MTATVAWDQTLVSAGVAAAVATLAATVAAGWAYRAAAHVLKEQERRRELGARREALEQVLLHVEGAVLDYLGSGNDDDYPQREMVELERSALQAQIYFLRDLEMQRALRDVCYPNRYAQAMQTIRRGIEAVEAEIAGGAAAQRD